MKKLFTEPELEILSFLCNGELDSVNAGENGVDGGDGSDIIFD